MWGSIDNIVVASYAEETNSLMLHRTPFGELKYCVAMEISFNDNTSPPIPNEDIGASLIGLVIRSFVVWPKVLIIFDDMIVNILSFI